MFKERWLEMGTSAYPKILYSTEVIILRSAEKSANRSDRDSKSDPYE